MKTQIAELMWATGADRRGVRQRNDGQLLYVNGILVLSGKPNAKVVVEVVREAMLEYEADRPTFMKALTRPAVERAVRKFVATYGLRCDEPTKSQVDRALNKLIDRDLVTKKKSGGSCFYHAQTDDEIAAQKEAKKKADDERRQRSREITDLRDRFEKVCGRKHRPTIAGNKWGNYKVEFNPTDFESLVVLLEKVAEKVQPRTNAQIANEALRRLAATE